MKIATRFLRGFVALAATLLFGVLLLSIVLIRTQPGHDFFLRVALSQASRFLDGEVSIGRLTSDGLLGGFLLRDVRIADSGGRPFVVADSLRVGYSISDLIDRNVVLVPLEIWRPTVVIETLHGGSRSNVARIFRGTESDSTVATTSPAASDSGEANPPVRFALRGTEIHDGSLLLRIPVETGTVSPRGLYERLDTGEEGDYRLLRFEEIQARVAEANLSNPDGSPPLIRLETLAFEGHLLDEPVTITEIRGDILLEDSGARLELDRLWLSGSEMSARVGVLWGGDEAVRIEAEVEADVIRSADFRWLDPRVPEGEGRMSLTVSGPLDRLSWRAADAAFDTGGSRISGRLGLDQGPELRFAATELDLRPLDLRDLDPWLAEPLPLVGLLTGGVQAEGPLDRLRVEAQLRFEDPDREIPPTDGVVEGTLRLAGGPVQTELDMTLDPFQYGTVRAFLPDIELLGEGRAHINVAGELSSNVQVSGELEHVLEGGGRSVVSLSGTVRPSAEDVELALAATLAPLSLDGVAGELGRSLPVSGEVSGSVRATGPLSDLNLSGTVSTAAGLLDADVRVNLRALRRGYRVDASWEAFRLDRLVSGLPEPTLLTGDVQLDGSGFDPGELSGTADLLIRESLVGATELSEVVTRLRAENGRLLVEDLRVRSPVITLTGSGDLALRDDQPEGVLSLEWAADSISALRPAILGDEVIAADTLTQLEREILLLEGINPDTLRMAEGVTLEGSASGELLLRGRVQALEGEGFAEVSDAVFGETAVRRSRADLRGSWRGAADWEADAVFDFDSLTFRGLSLERGQGGITYGSRGAGDFDLVLEGPSGDSYRTEGALSADSTGVDLAFRVLEARLVDGTWSLGAPSRINLSGSRIASDGLRLVRSSSAPGPFSASASVGARGILDPEGDSNFELAVSGVDLEEIGRILQIEGMPGGELDLAVAIRGPHGSPGMTGEVLVQDLNVNGTTLSRLEGTLTYAHPSLAASVLGERNGERLFSLDGRLPVDLSFGQVSDRFPDREIDVAVTVDSLPAATAFAFMEVLEQVEGTLEGGIRLQGTRENMRPSGEIRLRNGGLSIPGIGLRSRGITADLRVREDFLVEVEAEAFSAGQANVTGTLELSDLTDPVFDLSASATGFQAVARRDLTARVGADIQLTGPFTEPRITGAVDVEQGELFLEEFIRGAEVIDLSDPRFYDVVDTTIVTGPAAGPGSSPFLQNLRVDVALAMEQGFWIRSLESTQGMDVELEGDLGVTFDRPARELRLAGTLEPIRGSYTQFGRVFNVESGAIEFVGTPGIDPSLSIQAVHRLRRDSEEPLNVIANVGGTLQSPVVTLSSDAQPPIPESDLISYLLFGRPSYALASGEESVVESAAAGLGGAVLSLGVSQLGSTFSRSLGVDYLSVSRSQQTGGLSGFANAGGLFADTEVEMGRYVGDNVFISVVLRPLTGLSSTRRTQLPGARAEWRFDQYWSIRGFLEDRITRPGGSGFGELDNDFSRVFGLSLFRVWGY